MIDQVHVIMPEWISVKEAAEISGYKPAYLRQLIRQGRISAERKGTMYWIDRSSLQAYVDEMKRLGTQRFNWRRLRRQQEKQSQ
ncbi:MAG TPA: helix-turn-helix domain-containing protein [Caldilineae bacterium]|jgi:excisionase family DNA binding protein|nr:helix-turn-helix domain-containing protein [Caldilineae bacterium]